MPIANLSQISALTIVRRLEAATSRLEDMVPNMGEPSASTNGVQSNIGGGLTGVKETSPAIANGASSQRYPETLPPAIDDFDGIINGEVKTFVNMSEEIGGLVAEQVQNPSWSSLP